MQEGKTIGQLMEEMRQKAGAQNYHGHDYMDLQRFAENTRHMIIFDVLTHDSPVGWKGERTRLFLSDIGYEKALDSQANGQIKILSHAKVRNVVFHGAVLDASFQLALRGRARADLPQYRFAAQINGGSLLNYGTLDGGFYTAAGVLPPCKYFCVTNMPLDDQWTDQQAVLKAGAVDYVVALTGDLHGDFPQYAVIDRCSYDGGEGEVTWYLYQLQR